MSALAPKMNVQNFPRPPKLEKISRHVRVTWEGKDIAETKDAYWVLETHHPPSAPLFFVSLRIARVLLLRALTKSENNHMLTHGLICLPCIQHTTSRRLLFICP